MSLLDPTLDLVFKLLLTREPRLLVDMLHGVLAKPIREAIIVNPNILGEHVSDKAIVLDIRAALDDGSRADLEMQIRSPPPLPSRLVYYGARDYAGQLGRGEGYHLLTPTAVIVWMVEPLLPRLDRLHGIFELRERHTHMLFSDQLAIHLLQLGAVRSLRPPPMNADDARVERWARFLLARNEAELARLALEDSIMSLAKQTLEQLSEDPMTCRLAREREDAIKLYRMELVASEAKGREEGEAQGREEGEAKGREEGEAKGREEGEAKGREEGEAKGRAELLLKLLGLRFGAPSEGTRARLHAASIEQLDAWAERVLTAPTLEHVLAP